MSPGKKEWQRLVFAAWAVFAVSFLLPAYTEGAARTGIAGRLG